MSYVECPECGFKLTAAPETGIDTMCPTCGEVME